MKFVIRFAFNTFASEITFRKINTPVLDSFVDEYNLVYCSIYTVLLGLGIETRFYERKIDLCTRFILQNNFNQSYVIANLCYFGYNKFEKKNIRGYSFLIKIVYLLMRLFTGYTIFKIDLLRFKFITSKYTRNHFNKTVLSVVCHLKLV